MVDTSNPTDARLIQKVSENEYRVYKPKVANPSPSNAEHWHHLGKKYVGRAISHFYSDVRNPYIMLFHPPELEQEVRNIAHNKKSSKNLKDKLD